MSWEDIDWFDLAIRILVTGCVIFLLVAVWASLENESNRIDVGTVMEKDYTAPYTTWQQSGKTSFPVHHPATFSIMITDGDKCYWKTIPESVWIQAEVGDILDLRDFSIEEALR